MNIISAVNVIDGNQYLVNNDSNSSSGGTDFGKVYNNIDTGDQTLDKIFEKVSEEYGVNVNLLKAVAQAESGFDTNAVSWCGAQGIMQLMPATAASLEVEDPFDAEQCITGGAKMLGYLLDDYDGNATLALAAYNAGSGSVQKYGGVPPYDETLNYIDKINNILGGALANDSRTIEGSSATNLDGVSVGAAPDVATTGSNSAENQTVVTTGGLSGYELAGQLKAQADNASASSSELFSHDDDLYFVSTIKEVLAKLYDTASSEISSTTNNNSIMNTIADVLKGDNDTSDNSIFDVNELTSNGSVADSATTSTVPSTNDINSYVNSILQQSGNNASGSDAQALYEAQASVISPIVASMLDL